MDGIIRHLKVQELRARLFLHKLKGRTLRRELPSVSPSNARQG